MYFLRFIAERHVLSNCACNSFNCIHINQLMSLKPLMCYAATVFYVAVQSLEFILGVMSKH